MKNTRSWVAFGMIIAAVAALTGPTVLGGPASYVIVDGDSMQPTYVDGDLVIAYRWGGYDIDDTIVYDAPVDTQFNVIHRIIERTDGGFITQGDNRDEPDGWIAPDEKIYGKALFHIPRGGAIVSFLRQPAAILAFVAGWLTLAIFDRRRPADGQDAGRSDDTNRSDEEVGDAPAPPHLFMSTQTAPASSSDRQPEQKVKEPMSRKTVAIFGIAALIGGLAGVMVANAASLRVDAGVLQAFSIMDLPEPPAPPPAAGTVNLRVHFFSSGQGQAPGRELGEGRSPVVFGPITIPAGHSYDIEWDAPGNSHVVDCFDADSITFRDEPPVAATPQGTDGPFGPLDETESITHLLCIQTAPGNITENLTFTTIDDVGASTHVELSTTAFVDEVCDEPSMAECAEPDVDSEQDSAGSDSSSDGESPDDAGNDSDTDSGTSGDTSRSDGGNPADGSDENSTADRDEGSDGGTATSDPDAGTGDEQDDGLSVTSDDPLDAEGTDQTGDDS